MQLKVYLSTVTLTILMSLSGINPLPLEYQTPNILPLKQDFGAAAAPVATGSPLLMPQSDFRNQNPKSSTRHNTQARPVIPETSVNLASSQVSNIRQASQGQSGPGSLSPTWPGLKLPGPTRNVQPIIDHPDHLVEGSGAGPPSSKEVHKSKLDDTDDSGDDGDDEDYDDVDSSQGGLDHSGRVSSSTQRPNMSGSPGDINNKPDYNNFYKPFRPAVTTTPPISNLNSMYNQTRPITSPPTSLPIRPFQPSISRQSSRNATLLVDAPAEKFPPVSKNKTEIDYDYVDENDDDELEETSVFEDNDNDESEFPANKTFVNNPQISPPLTVQRINDTKPGSSTPKLVVNTPIGPRQEESSPNIPPSKPDTFATILPLGYLQPQNNITPVTLYNLTTTTSKPIIEQIRPSTEPVKVDDEEEEEEEEEEVEEEEDGNTELDDGDLEEEEEEVSQENSKPINTRPPITNPNLLGTNIQANQYRPETISSLPTNKQQNNTQGAAVLQAIPNSSLGSRQPGFVPTTVPSIQPSSTMSQFSTPKVSISPVNTNPTTPMPNVIPTSSTTTVRPTLESVSLPTTLRPPMFVNVPTVSYQPQGSSSPPHTLSPPNVPLYFPTTLRPYFTSPAFPTKRLMSVATTNVEPYDQSNINLSNSDDSLTRQIYDKAKEAYFEADRTVRAAVDAVWPPNFNFDSNSLEPILAQPIFFMLALGGAIICLVLLMMLIVYMISYQTKPRRYEPDDISIY